MDAPVDLVGESASTVAPSAAEGSDPRRRAHVVAITSPKGGTGKSTYTAMCGEQLARRGRRVLLVDIDESGNLTQWLAADPLDAALISAALRGDIAGEEAVRATLVAGMDIIGSGIETRQTWAEIDAGRVGRERALVKVLRPLIGSYDDILIDTKGDMSIATVAALTAADSVWVPLEHSRFSINGLMMARELVEEIVDAELNPDLRIEAVTIVRARRQTNMFREVAEAVQALYPDAATHPIPEAIVVAEASSLRIPLAEAAPVAAPTVAASAVVDQILARRANVRGHR